MSTPTELSQMRFEAMCQVVTVARQLVASDREFRSFAGIMLREAVRELDAIEAKQREAASPNSVEQGTIRAAVGG